MNDIIIENQGKKIENLVILELCLGEFCIKNPFCRKNQQKGLEIMLFCLLTFIFRNYNY